MTLTFDPLTLNGCHVIKLCTKVERNRTIRGGVIAIDTHPIWAPCAILDLSGSGFQQFRGLEDPHYTSVKNFNTMVLVRQAVRLTSK